MSRKKGKEKDGREEQLSAMFGNIEKARKAGKGEGVEACLRIVDALESTATRDQVAEAIRTEMKRRSWIE